MPRDEESESMPSIGQSAEAAPIIIKKKKGGHGGHHGGAWKVAYADFVTAMMALFIVLWLMNTSSRVQRAIGGYFKDPTGVGKMVGTAMAGAGQGVEITKNDLERLQDKLNDSFRQMPEFDKLKDNVELILTPEGLRLELLENETGLFFETGKPAPTGAGQDLLERLAGELGKLPNSVLIEGHTDARPFASDHRYGNWELSSDRANMARRIMQDHGLRSDQVTQVRGFADQQLRKKDAPADATNRRISVIIKSAEMQGPPPSPDAEKTPPGKAGSAPNGEVHKAENQSAHPPPSH